MAMRTDLPWGVVSRARAVRGGGRLARASIASAISAAGLWNPNATRVRTRILVLVDSISP